MWVLGMQLWSYVCTASILLPSLTSLFLSYRELKLRWEVSGSVERGGATRRSDSDMCHEAELAFYELSLLTSK